MRSIICYAFVLCLACTGQAQSQKSPEPTKANDAAEQDWQSVISTLNPPAGRSMTRGAPPPRRDWAAAAEKAREYQTKHPGSLRAKEARKLEITAELSQHMGKGSIPAGISEKLEAYLADPEVPAADRFDVSMMEKDARDLRPGMKREEVNAKRLANIRDLLVEFPDEPRVWMRLLAVARGMPGQQGRNVAQEIVASEKAPEEIKAQARQLVIQRELVGRPLEGIDLSSASGKPALVYFWTVAKPEFSELLRHYEQVPGIVFIGVNMDADGIKAREFARQVSLPGKQYYDGEDGPVAFRLKVETAPAIYLVDEKGILKDTQGHIGTLMKLRGMTSPDAGIRNENGRSKK
jgi:hypothetical protein